MADEISVLDPFYDEWESDEIPHHVGKWSFANSQQTITFKVRDTVVDLFIARAIGQHYRDGNRLVRKIPIQHPRYPHLYCTDIDQQPFAPTKPAAPGLAPGAPGSHLYETIWGTFQKYDFHWVTATYTALPFDTKFHNNDDAVNMREHLRYTTVLDNAGAEAYPVPGSRLKYVQGDTSPPRNALVGGAGGTQPAPQKTIGKSDITITWWCVPHLWVSRVDSTICPNWDGYVADVPANNWSRGSKIGHVNYKDFLGYEAGTLLLMGVSKREIAAPWVDYSLSEKDRYYRARLWNITFHMKYTNPVPGSFDINNPAHHVPGPGINVDGVAGKHLKGWNTVAFSGDPKLGNFLARTVFAANDDGPLLFPTYNYENFFRHESAVLLKNED